MPRAGRPMFIAASAAAVLKSLPRRSTAQAIPRKLVS
jgi:hypothetical protein